jgi:FixJ family two-component response regulator
VSKDVSIAVIDDDQPFRMALVESLCSFGYEVRGFASAEDLLAADGQGSCDCIITDVQMPGMSGLDLKRVLTVRNCGVPVIMITAHGDPGLEAKAAATGAVGLLRKPFDANAWVGFLEKALKS